MCMHRIASHRVASHIAGENTLEAQLVRVLMRSIVECGGEFVAPHFCDAYVKFMTTPGSHNDTYASTAHRQVGSRVRPA